MTVMHAQPFHAVLFPHRSLGRRGFWVVIALVGCVMIVAGGRALALGAWPVALFGLADLALVWGAFELNYRAARQFEEITVTGREVLIRQVNAAGHAVEHRFDPHWGRLQITRKAEEGVTRLAFGSHGRHVVIGAFLNPADRASFADAFADALSRVRAPGPD